jgi:hypothetical protein
VQLVDLLVEAVSIPRPLPWNGPLDPGTFGHGGLIEPTQRRRFDIRARRGRVVFPYLPDDVFEIRLRVSIDPGPGNYPMLIPWRLDPDSLLRR